MVINMTGRDSTANDVPPSDTTDSDKQLISQEAYNMLLLEKTAFLLKSNNYFQEKNVPTRKLTARDLQRSFTKAATQAKINVKGRDDVIDEAFAKAIHEKYGINIRRYLGQRIWDAVQRIAENNLRKKRPDQSPDQPERRKNTF